MEKKQKEEKIDIQKEYGQMCINSAEEFFKEILLEQGMQNKENSKTQETKREFIKTGLTKSEVEQNQNKYGLNQIQQSKPRKWYHYLIQSFISPFNIILLGITLVLIYTDIILSEQPSYANIIVIIILILASTLLEFFEVFKSNKAAEKLKNLVAVTTTVIREGRTEKIPLDQITIGDVVSLSAGDLIPADLKIVEEKDLHVVQSSLTGESDAVRKVAKSKIQKVEQIEDVTDLDNICFMGTNVMSGTRKRYSF